MTLKRLEPHCEVEALCPDHAMCQSGEALEDQAHVCSAEDQTHQGPDVAAGAGTGPCLPAWRGIPTKLQ